MSLNVFLVFMSQYFFFSDSFSDLKMNILDLTFPGDFRRRQVWKGHCQPGLTTSLPVHKGTHQELETCCLCGSLPFV